jgi:hypothetical protein
MIPVIPDISSGTLCSKCGENTIVPLEKIGFGELPVLVQVFRCKNPLCFRDDFFRRSTVVPREFDYCKYCGFSWHTGQTICPRCTSRHSIAAPLGKCRCHSVLPTDYRMYCERKPRPKHYADLVKSFLKQYDLIVKNNWCVSTCLRRINLNISKNDSCCAILRKHSKALSGDPERLTTDFMKKMTLCSCKRPKKSKEKAK